MAMRPAVGWWQVPAFGALVRLAPAWAQPMAPMAAPPPQPPVFSPQGVLPQNPDRGRSQALALRGWFSTGYGCNVVPILSESGRSSVKRAFLGIEYGVYIPLALPYGELSVGWEGRHGFISEDYSAGENSPGICGTKPGDTERYPTAFFSLHPGVSFRTAIAVAPKSFSLSLVADAAFMVKQLSYTQASLISRGPEAGVGLDFEVLTPWRIRPVASVFFRGMQPLTGAGAASSPVATFASPDEEGVFVDREFSGSSSLQGLRFGASAGVSLGSLQRQNLNVAVGFSQTRNTYKGIYSDTYYRKENEQPDKTFTRRVISQGTGDAADSETFFFLTIKGEPR